MASTFFCSSVICRRRLFSNIVDNAEFRRYSSEKSLRSPAPSSSKYVKSSSGFRHYFTNKVSAYVKGYERFLEKWFPTAYRVYKVFIIGTKDLYKEAYYYYRLSADLKLGKPYWEFTRSELEKLYQMPSDIRKITPTILLTGIPLSNYIILPLAYKYPHFFLTRQFWSPQQRLDFALIDHRKKLHNYRPVFRKLQSKLDDVQDPLLKDKCMNIFHKLGSGLHPTATELSRVQPLFDKGPYDFHHLSSSHISSLCHVHGLSHRFPFKRRRLLKKANFMWYIDLAVKREGMDGMTMEELQEACFFRGLNPVGLSREEICQWLQNWITVTSNLKATSLSMILHCPILLSYNCSTNWVLIH